MSKRVDAGQRPQGRPTGHVEPSFFEIVPNGTKIDFVSRWPFFAAASLLAIALCAAAIPLRGVRLGVDFAGGHRVVVRLPGEPGGDESRLRAALISLGIPEPGVTRIGPPADGVFETRFAELPNLPAQGLGPHLGEELTRLLGAAEIESVDFVGPRVGADLRRGAVLALGIAFLLILIYVAVRFAPSFAPGAVLALVHDVSITAGVFVVLGWELDLNLIAALLTIIGYSLNDTIVIYDRVRENRTRYAGADLPELINRSINETLSRTFLTAGLTFLAVLALLLVAGRELRGFSAAMAIGIVAGTYSTIYVAAPFVLLIEKWRLGSAGGAAKPQRRAAERPTR